MGIVASYVRASPPDTERIRENPDAFWEIQEMSWDLSKLVSAGSERLEIDKMWENLSWLCSPLGRAEAHHMAALIHVDISIKDNSAFKAALAKQVAAMGLTWIDPDTLPDDPVLSAIQGRRGENQTADIPDFGLHASVFAPEEVVEMYSALDALQVDDLRNRFDVREIEALQLGGDSEESELDELYLPMFDRLKTFYSRAAAARQHVIVVMS